MEYLCSSPSLDETETAPICAIWLESSNNCFFGDSSQIAHKGSILVSSKDGQLKDIQST